MPLVPVPRIAQRSPLHDLGLPMPDRRLRALARAGWSVDDVTQLLEIAGGRAADLLDSVLDGQWPDPSPACVLGWLHVCSDPLLAVWDDPQARRRQLHGISSWTRTFGALGPLGHAAGLTLQEAVHLLAAGRFTRELLEERVTERLLSGQARPAPVASWADRLRSPA